MPPRHCLRVDTWHVAVLLCIAIEIYLQVLPLCQSLEPMGVNMDDGSEEGPHSFVCLCFGVKQTPPKIYFRMDLCSVLWVSGLVKDDLWDATVPLPKEMFCNTRINIAVSSNGNNS